MYIPKSQIAKIIPPDNLVYKKTDKDYSLSSAYILRNNKIYGTDGEELAYKGGDINSNLVLLIDNPLTRSIITLKSLPIDHFYSQEKYHYFAYNLTKFKEISIDQFRKMKNKEKGSIDYYTYKILSVSLENIYSIYYTNHDIYTYLNNTYLST